MLTDSLPTREIDSTVQVQVGHGCRTFWIRSNFISEGPVLPSSNHTIICRGIFTDLIYVIILQTLFWKNLYRYFEVIIIIGRPKNFTPSISVSNFCPISPRSSSSSLHLRLVLHLPLVILKWNIILFINIKSISSKSKIFLRYTFSVCFLKKKSPGTFWVIYLFQLEPFCDIRQHY